MPPLVPYWIPFLGSALQYGKDPIGFLTECQQKVGRESVILEHLIIDITQYGNVFTFKMIGRRFTVVLGPQGTHFVMSGHSDAISAGQAQRVRAYLSHDFMHIISNHTEPYYTCFWGGRDL